MGLGMTLTLLSLIAFDKCENAYVEEIEEEGERMIVSGVKKSKRGRATKKAGNNSYKRLLTDDAEKAVKGQTIGGIDSKTILVVCPSSVISSWTTQLPEHTRPGSLKTHFYYGERTQDASELLKYDIVLTTYGTLAGEENSLQSPMKKIEWWRVILDKAHIIKNAKSQQSWAVANLNAKRRWIVTGTPIQNGSMDLFDLMAFYRFLFSIKSRWDIIQCQIAQQSDKGLSTSRLQVLLATMTLRRTKDKALVELPPKVI